MNCFCYFCKKRMFFYLGALTEKTIWEVYFKYPLSILHFYFRSLKSNKINIYALSELPKKKYKWSIKTEKIKRYFVYTSIITLLDFFWKKVYILQLQVYFWVWKEIIRNLFRKSTSNIHLLLVYLGNLLLIYIRVSTYIDKFRKFASSILQSFKVNIYINIESLLLIYFRVRR